MYNIKKGTTKLYLQIDKNEVANRAKLMKMKLRSESQRR